MAQSNTMWRRSSTLLALLFSVSALMAAAAVASRPGEVVECATPSPAPQMSDLLLRPLPAIAESTRTGPVVTDCGPVPAARPR